MSTKPNLAFVPGFATEAQALVAGRKFFAKSNGTPGILGRDFHVVQNEKGRWHFEAGRGAIAS